MAKNTIMPIRVSSESKKRYEQAAKAAGKNLSEWLLGLADKACVLVVEVAADARTEEAMSVDESAEKVSTPQFSVLSDGTHYTGEWAVFNGKTMYEIETSTGKRWTQVQPGGKQ